MRIIVRNSDNVVVMYSRDGKPEAAADQTAHDLSDELASEFNSIISQPNGGITFDGTSFTSLPAPLPPPTRAVCSKWQFRKELRELGILNEVTQLVAVSGEEAQEAFDHASEFWSDNPMLISLAANLTTPLSASQVYDLIVSASKRVVGTA